MIRKNHGFSLAELSIVLVILGLLTGGILAGRSLVRASELRSVSTDLIRVRTAMNSFRDKYFMMPGDLNSATSFWGAQDATHATCIALDHTTPSTDARTCNGNGDGYIGTGAGSYERFRVWQHLANAGMIEGSYSGVRGPSGGNQLVAGLNAPVVKLSTATMLILNWNNGGTPGTPQANSTTFFDGDYSNSISYGKMTTGSPMDPLFTPEEAWNIDTKIDDGKPGTGIVHPMTMSSGQATNCTDSDVEATSNYVLSYAAAACQIMFLQQR